MSDARRAGMARYQPARQIQRRFDQRARNEWRRIAARDFQGRPLNAWEREILDRGLRTPPVGAPTTFAMVHGLIAKHCWWLRETGLTRDAAEAGVARAWNISRGLVRKCATGRAHKASAQQWARDARKESVARPASSIEEMFALAAATFAQAAEK